ncbi:OLC1v1024351C1 [Oldenlandia corymbosa var. corymbosa]|uniref:OLC1v1024351C1 n=1 Tax=Oldenlandia corymbosa var. corymbosa TaxID=529605 RepID=A0AAV1C4Y4_OLDCO|nr:OLC1v1024351C1 [Oldenlandia corymbosa var. corymbosa]
MAGNARFELNSAGLDAIFPGNYAQRGGYSGPILDRSGSFRDISDGRMFNSGKGKARGSGAPTGDQSSFVPILMLDPIDGIDLKQHPSLELRRVLGFSVGNSMEDSSLGTSHLRNSPPASIEELKRFRESVADTCIRASGRAKTLDEWLHKLTKYCEGTTSKKQQRNELLASDRSGSSNLKLGSLMLRSPSDLSHPKLDDRSKNVVLNKHVRTSVAETRAEGRSNGLPRQPLAISRDRDMVKGGSVNSGIVEEKIRKLPAGGESWDKKMKRKRSVGAICARPIDSDEEPKRAVHHKLTSEPELQSSDYPNLICFDF